MNKIEQFEKVKHLGTIANREKRRAEYLANPNYCLYCGKVIELKEHQQPSEVRVKKFCNRSHAASYNNRGKDRHTLNPTTRGPRATRIKWETSDQPVGKCEKCDADVTYKQDRDRPSYIKKKYCDQCRAEIRSAVGKKWVQNKITNKGLQDWSDINQMTKQEVLEKSGGHSWTMKCTITRYARRSYRQAGKPHICQECGYDKHINVCHIRDVSDFPMDALIGEINHLDNLVGLCPNHHWEFDHGQLVIGKSNAIIST